MQGHNHRILNSCSTQTIGLCRDCAIKMGRSCCLKQKSLTAGAGVRRSSLRPPGKKFIFLLQLLLLWLTSKVAGTCLCWLTYCVSFQLSCLCTCLAEKGDTMAEEGIPLSQQPSVSQPAAKSAGRDRLRSGLAVLLLVGVVAVVAVCGTAVAVLGTTLGRKGEPRQQREVQMGDIEAQHQKVHVYLHSLPVS